MGSPVHVRRALLGAALVLLACAFPAVATASGTASVSGATLTYNGGAETNFISFTVPAAGTIRVTEGNSGTTVTAGTGCSTVTSLIVDCNSAGVTLIVANGGDGNDGLENLTTTTAHLNGDNDWDDLLSTSPTNDTLDGGAGVYVGATDSGDYADYAIAGAPVTVNLTTGQATGATIGTDTITNVESIDGSPFADTLTANSLDNQIIGGDGDDVMSSGAGNDNMQGDTGADTYDTGPGFDSIQDDLTNGDIDTSDYSTKSAGITVAASSSPPPFPYTSELAVSKPDGSDTLYDVPNVTGTSFADTMTGDGNANIFDGGAGDDTFNGAGGGDTFTGGGGSNTVSYSDVTGPIDASLMNGSATTPSGTDNYTGIQNLTGSPGTDTIEGDAAANVLNGGGGNDTLTFANAPAAVTVTYTSATGTTSGAGAGSDTLSGFKAFVGSPFADTLNFRNSVANTIGCGGSADLIEADPIDTLGGDCETVAPEAAGTPTIDSGGVAMEGATFSATQGVWGGTLPITFSYQWLRCNTAGAACVVIPGATGPTYTATSADAGHTLRSRVTAVNPAGSDQSTSPASGVIQAAPTPPAAAAVVTPPGADPVPAAAPLPVFTKFADAEPVSGRVLIRFPGTSKFVRLIQPELVPFHSIIDARHGRLRLRTIDARNKIQTADFYGGVFQIFQRKVARGLTEANLYGGKFSVCPALGASKGKKAGLARKKVKANKTIRHLWSSGQGLFRTKGRYSSATIRGTTWLTADRCDGTLTRVTQGKVTVRDFVKNRSITVKAPKSYLATPKR